MCDAKEWTATCCDPWKFTQEFALTSNKLPVAVVDKSILCTDSAWPDPSQQGNRPGQTALKTAWSIAGTSLYLLVAPWSDVYMLLALPASSKCAPTSGVFFSAFSSSIRLALSLPRITPHSSACVHSDLTRVHAAAVGVAALVETRDSCTSFFLEIRIKRHHILQAVEIHRGKYRMCKLDDSS